jgi:hypothetical protein
MQDTVDKMNKDALLSKPGFAYFEQAMRNWSPTQYQAFVMYMWIYKQPPTLALMKKFDAQFNASPH